MHIGLIVPYFNYSNYLFYDITDRLNIAPNFSYSWDIEATYDPVIKYSCDNNVILNTLVDTSSKRFS